MTARDVAKWMLKKLEEVKYLYQEEVVYEISEKFGEEFTYINENGNDAIDRAVLKEFRKLTSDSVIWERGERMWRFREEYDEEGRSQD